MDSTVVTLWFAKIVGPILLLRAISIVLDRKHFIEMLDGLEREVSTVSFSFFPIALFATCLAIALIHSDTSSLAALLIHVIAWGGVLKASVLILFPRLAAVKAKALGKAGFLWVVLLVCFIAGGYFTWFGYLSNR